MFKLYQCSSCPYCQKVLRALGILNLKEGKDYMLVEASRGTPGRAEVENLGGNSQVPFFVEGSTKMYESDDIIKYIKKKFSK